MLFIMFSGVLKSDNLMPKWFFLRYLFILKFETFKFFFIYRKFLGKVKVFSFLNIKKSENNQNKHKHAKSKIKFEYPWKFLKNVIVPNKKKNEMFTEISKD